MMEVDIKKAVFFKQCPCYHFSLYPNSPYQVTRNFNCFFRESDSKLESHPPAAIIDNYCSKETLYLLQWKTALEEIKLYIRSLQSDDWIKIKMNIFPDHITISKETIFIIGGQQLFIFTPKYIRTDRVLLHPHEIVSVHPWVYDSLLPNSEDQPEYEPGIYVLYKKQNRSFISGEYSSNRSIIKEERITRKISNFFQKKEQRCHHIEVIVPNLLGIAFLADRKICVFNLNTLQTMQEVYAEFPFTLKKDERPVFKWKKHQMQGYNDSFLILIGIGSYIFSFYLMLKYTIETVELGLEHEPLTNFLNTDVIDWSTLNLKSYLTFVMEGNHLVDLAISTKGMIYQSKSSHSDLLGECKYIDMMSLLNEYPVVTQQCPIWRLYYEDKQESFKIDENRLVVPNRYPYQMVDYLHSQQVEIQDSNELALNLWRNRYHFSAFLTFEEELLIVRKGSISVFRNIPSQLFNMQYLTHNQLRAIQALTLSPGSLSFSQDIDMIDDFQDPGLKLTDDRPLISERNYKILSEIEEETEEFIQIQIKNEQSSSVINELEDILIENHEHVYRSLTTTKFQFQLICHELKTKLNFFNFILNSSVYCLNKDDRERQYNKIYEKNSFVARVVDYFYASYFRAAEFYRIFGLNLTDLFVDKQKDRLSDDINTSVHIIMQMMLINLMPKELANQDSSLIIAEVREDYRFFSNPFFDFLIQKFKEAVDNQDSQRIKVLSQEFSHIVNIGFFQKKSIFFNQLWRNISLFQVLLLSNETDLLERVFVQSLLFNLKAKEMHLQYQRIKQYMPNRNIAIIERQLFINESKHDLKLDKNYLDIWSWVDGDIPEQIISKFVKINSDIIQKQATIEKMFAKEDHMTKIMPIYDNLMTQQSFNQKYFHQLKKHIKQTSLPTSEDKLQFFQQILSMFVKLFNNRIEKDHSIRYDFIRNNEIDFELYQESREILRLVLKSVRQYFELYQQLFMREYGGGEGMPLLEKTRQEEKMMEETFIDSPMRLINIDSGLILSHTAFKLIQTALSSSQFTSSLKEIPNLLCFWFQHLNRLPENQIAFSYLYLQGLDTHKAIDSLIKECRYSNDIIQDLKRGRQEHNYEIIKNVIVEMSLIDVI